MRLLAVGGRGGWQQSYGEERDSKASFQPIGQRKPLIRTILGLTPRLIEQRLRALRASPKIWLKPIVSNHVHI